MMWDEVTDLTSPIWYEGILQTHSHVQVKNRYLNCVLKYVCHNSYQFLLNLMPLCIIIYC